MYKTIFSLIIFMASFNVIAQNIKDEHIFLIRIPATNNHKQSIQTGFRLKNTKGIVTALHGVVHGEIFSAINQHHLVFTKLKIVKVDVAHDIALLSSSELESQPAEGLDIAERPSSPFYVFGHPAGINLRAMPVAASSSFKPLSALIATNSAKSFDLRKSPNTEINIIDLTGVLGPGYSGSPLVDQNGKVLGIVDGGLKEYAISWAIPINVVKNLVSVELVKSRINELAAMKTKDLFLLSEDTNLSSHWVVSKFSNGDFDNITDAIKQSKEGDTILVKEGDYRNDPTGLRGTINATVTLAIIGDGDSSKIILPGINVSNKKLYLKNISVRSPINLSVNAVLIAKGCRLFGSRFSSTIVETNGGRLELYNTIVESYSSSIGIEAGFGSSITMQNCTLKNFRFCAIRTMAAVDLLIENSHIHKNDVAIDTFGGCHVTIRNSDLSKNRKVFRKIESKDIGPVILVEENVKK